MNRLFKTKNLMRTEVGFFFIIVNLESGRFWIIGLQRIYPSCSQARTVSWQAKKGFRFLKARAVSWCLGSRQRQTVMKGPAALITFSCLTRTKIYVGLKFEISNTANGLNRVQRVQGRGNLKPRLHAQYHVQIKFTPVYRLHQPGLGTTGYFKRC